jgi:hypothetical protein
LENASAVSLSLSPSSKAASMKILLQAIGESTMDNIGTTCEATNFTSKCTLFVLLFHLAFFLLCLDTEVINLRHNVLQDNKPLMTSLKAVISSSNCCHQILDKLIIDPILVFHHICHSLQIRKLAQVLCEKTKPPSQILQVQNTNTESAHI